MQCLKQECLLWDLAGMWGIASTPIKGNEMQPLINGWEAPTGVHGGDSPEHSGEQEPGSGLTPAPEPHRIEGDLAPRSAGKLQPSWRDPGFNQLEPVGSFRLPQTMFRRSGQKSIEFVLWSKFLPGNGCFGFPPASVGRFMKSLSCWLAFSRLMPLISRALSKVFR